MIFDGYLLMSDLDHTLIEKGEICQRSIDAIKYFTENGGLFGIASGRHPLIAKGAFEDTRSNCPSILFGSLVYDIPNDKPIWYSPIKETTKKTTLELLEKFPEVGAIIYTLKDIYIVRESDATIRYKETKTVFWGLTQDADIMDIYDKEWIKVIFTKLDLPYMSNMERYASAQNYSDFQGVMSEPHLYEINSGSEYSKGTALKYLGEYLGIEHSKICAIGDYYNDVPMLQYAGISATVADANEDIKNIVDFVGGRCLEGAVADFIEYIEKTVKEK